MRVFKQTTTGHLFPHTPEIEARADMREVKWPPGADGRTPYLDDDEEIVITKDDADDALPRVADDDDDADGEGDADALGEADGEREGDGDAAGEGETEKVALTRDEIPGYIGAITDKQVLEDIGRQNGIELDRRKSVAKLQALLIDALQQRLQG